MTPAYAVGPKGRTSPTRRRASRAVGTGTLRLTERFTRVDAATLLYEYRVGDPATYIRPFTAAVPMRLSEVPFFEYACHEGSYGMRNALSGAPAAEASAR